MPCNQEVIGLNLAGNWTFFFSLSFPTLLLQRSVPNQFPEGGASLSVCRESNIKCRPSSAAWAKTTSDWEKNI